MTSMVGFSNCCSSSSRPMPDSRRYATISLLSRMGNEYACTMVIGDRHTTKPQNPTKTQTHRTNENPIHRNTIKEQLLSQLRQECKTRLRARSAAFAVNNTREKRVEAGSRSFQTSGGRVSLIPAGFVFHNGSTDSLFLFGWRPGRGIKKF